MKNCAIVGINWGDEGKGRMVDYLAKSFDIVVRYQGGNNAGHTVINEYGKNALNLLPSGIFSADTLNLLGCGTVIDPQHLCGEIDSLRLKGVSISPANLRISDRATLVLPFHKLQDQLEEKRLGSAKYGSTQRGIAPAYGDKYLKKAIQMGDLLRKPSLEKHLKMLIDWKNAVFAAAYSQPPIDFDETMAYINTYCTPLLDYICDAGALLEEAQTRGRAILFEAQLGALRDIDYGIYPYTSSSSPLAAYAPIGCGMPSAKIDRIVGVMKAYSTCVGEGPFVGELSGEEASLLREAGGEYGAATGRPRRVAYFDVVASRYGVKLQGATELALTKIDVLSYLKEIPVCVGYRVDGKIVERFPYTPDLEGAEPIFEVLPGWGEDISALRRYEDLPEAARSYIEFIEKAVGCPIPFVSVGPGRDELIIREV